MTTEALTAEFVDLEQAAIAEADRKFGDLHGAVEEWSPLEEVQYVRLIERVHGLFHTDDLRAVA